MSIEGEIPFRSAQTSGQKFVLLKNVVVVDYSRLKNGGQENACSGINDTVSVARSHTHVRQD